MNRKIYLLFLLYFGFGILFVNGQVLVKRNLMLMGSQFSISVNDKDSSSANYAIDLVRDEIARIENLISEWRPETQVSAINQGAGIHPVPVDHELFQLTKRAVEYSKMSNGAFDISIAALDKIWKFDGSMEKIPDSLTVRNSVQRVGYENIILDSVHSTVFLKLPGMKIGFGSIGKGYAADKGRALLENLHVNGGIVDASGDMATFGMQPNGKPWNIGLNNPLKPHKMLTVFKFERNAVATSGNYEKYVEFNHIRYAHIINPQTGYPAQGLISVTVVGTSAEFANALSTAVMVLGKEKGIILLKKFPAYQFILITDKGRIIKK